MTIKNLQKITTRKLQSQEEWHHHSQPPEIPRNPEYHRHSKYPEIKKCNLCRDFCTTAKCGYTTHLSPLIESRGKFKCKICGVSDADVDLAVCRFLIKLCTEGVMFDVQI
ncbi:uncharacterized protein LOC124458279 isoform X2 [Xenia sp. Carnegie-2017]|uniref:uncharacterized protein LOC124458279 isoform X2 n=1 Tax=Xenia sp. Carnegie-2017 TaxID=2897299 RepID=UPI001F0501C8|nr:uncharacterized protein LOC124458279 isoform X2 [Xenia sp. Carnegie-2017]